MRKEYRQKLDRVTRVRDFGQANASQFPPGSRGHGLFARVAEHVAQMETMLLDRRSDANTARDNTRIRAALREEIYNTLRDINRSAISLSSEIPGLDIKLTMPTTKNEVDLLVAAQQFVKDTRPYVDKFIEDEMSADFLTTLETKIQQLSQMRSGMMAKQSSSRATTDQVNAHFARGVALIGNLNSLIINKFSNNPDMVALWKSTMRPGRVSTRSTVSESPENPDEPETQD